jgi:exosortase A-associated hydrolase 1
MPESYLNIQCEREELAGILHTPESPSKPHAVLFVVGGPQYRVGSHRQFVLMARDLCAAGYPVLRFDYRGMGDSEGESRSFESVDTDIRAAMDALATVLPSLRGIVLFGLCDGASASLMYASTDSRLTAVAIANPWVRTEVGEARAYARHYFAQRLVQRSFWQKVWSGGFNARASLSGLIETVRRARVAAAASSDHPSEGFIDRMFRGFKAVGPRPVLVLLSDRDLTAREFEDHCARSPDWRQLLAGPNVERTLIRDADHTFSSHESLRAATQAMVEWLDRRVQVAE